jgi:hypothetical protein
LAQTAALEQEPVAWTATRLWNRKELWTCPADIERDLLEGYAHPPRHETEQAEPVAWLELRTLSSGGYASPIKEWHVTQNPSTSNAPRKPLYTHPAPRLTASGNYSDIVSDGGMDPRN